MAAKDEQFKGASQICTSAGRAGVGKKVKRVTSKKRRREAKQLLDDAPVVNKFRGWYS